MRKDKKSRAGRLRFIVMDAVGKARTDDTVDDAVVMAVLDELGA